MNESEYWYVITEVDTYGPFESKADAQEHIDFLKHRSPVNDAEWGMEPLLARRGGKG
jgi:hypothetical protein